MMAREARLMRVEGLVQGVGFRPTVWRIAAALNLAGEVFNDPEGVGIFSRATRRRSTPSLKNFAAGSLRSPGSTRST